MDYDILIIGGGMVGASLATALKHVPLRIGIVEAVDHADANQPSYDTRAIALSLGSARIFDAMGVWQAMLAEGVTPINDIHVSDRGHFGNVRLNAGEEGVEALGYVVEAGVIGKALNAALKENPHAELICPARLVSIEIGNEQVAVSLEHRGERRELTCRLVVAADGTRSTVRELTGAKTFRLGYGQTAIIANVVTEREHGNVAYERFTDSGPLALLPSRAPAGSPGEEEGDHRWSLVWTARDDQVEAIMGLSDSAFIARLQKRLGRRVGRVLKTTPRYAYSLALLYVRDHVRSRLAFIGNAAHAIHPVGGQGFNLGLRDVAELAEVLAEAAGRGDDPGTLATLKPYADWRRPDYLRVLGLTDGLVRGFSTNFKPAVVARDFALLTLDLLPSMRHQFARQFMGLTGRQPKLARGLPLE
jgi:2-octaprenyl-6-methoxyphenol hydroxylase